MSQPVLSAPACPLRQIADHQQPVRYQLSPPPEPRDVIDAKSIYIHPANGHRNHMLDEATQLFVNETRIKA
jgi:hopanoid C-3 methylase